MPTRFRVVPDPHEKLSLLDDATRFEPAGSDPLVEQAQAAPRPGAPKPLPCISEVSTPTGKKPIMKAMMTTACERNCFYCPFRAGRSRTERLTFQPDEMAQTFDLVQRAGLADGLFLSSGIIKGGVSAQDKIIDAAEIVRKKHAYRGYLHLKIMPGAERDQIRRAMQLADRVSVNLEGPTQQRLELLAPKKDYFNELFTRIEWIGRLRREEGLRASVVTQFVVGAVGETDVELLQVSEHLYRHLGLKRAYFSSFSPVEQTPFENLPSSPAERELRLYQASFLLRDYGWSFEDLPFQAGGATGGQTGHLPLGIDPKMAWALENLREERIEVNRAERAELLRIPGIGPKAADAILAQRRCTAFTDLAHLRRVGVRDAAKAAPFILLDGHAPARQLPLWNGR